MITVETIVELAQEIEMADPIDWGMLSISEEATYNMLASSLLEQFNSLDPKERELMLLATTTKLVVENFVLNLKARTPL